MIEKTDIEKVAEILRLHDEAFKDYLERHNYGHKSSEGALSIHFGNFWDREGWNNSGAFGQMGVGIYSYALGPSRMHHFASVEEALVEVRKWHKAQMEAADDVDLDSPESPFDTDWA